LVSGLSTVANCGGAMAVRVLAADRGREKFSKSIELLARILL
jgi:hypothetical protein